MGAILLALLAGSGGEELRLRNERTVDTSSLESIVRDVVRLSGAKSNDEKAVAIHTWLHQAIFHCAYPAEQAPQSVGPLKVLRVYGWGLCGGQHTVLKALFETAGWTVRYRGWDGHTTIEVNYDGAWHYFDVFLKCYYWTKDRRTIASQDDILKDPSIVTDAAKEGRAPKDHHLCCGDTTESVVAGIRTSKPLPPSKPQDGWASVTGRDRNWDPSLVLPAGARLRLEWKGEPGGTAVAGRSSHSCGTKDFRGDPVLGPLLEHYGVRNHSNGTLLYEPSLAKGARTHEAGLRLPYPYVTLKVDAVSEGGDATVRVSTDGGKTWAEAPGGDATALVRQKYDVRVQVEGAGPLTRVRAEGRVEHNRSALPYLLPGSNPVTLEAGPGTAATYAWREATAPEGRKRWDGAGLAYGPERTERIVPGRREIRVGGNTPPKMLWIEFAADGR
jgi:hypothetical protein